MKLYYKIGRVKVYRGDCLELLEQIPKRSIDAVVTDPPYGLEFMGKEWDKLEGEPEHWNKWKAESGRYHNDTNFLASGNRPRYGKNGVVMQEWHYKWARRIKRVLKPGGHMLVFGGTRTSHRLVCALEDAGFEIRDCVMWVYGSGFPKSLNVSKAIDKAAGVERKKISIGPVVKRIIPGADQNRTGSWIKDNGRTFQPGIEISATDTAKQWDGWGTALKPAWEPIILVRKPLSELTVAANILKWGTGALNIDGSRVAVDPEVDDMLREVHRKKRKSQTWEKGSGFKNERNPRTGVPPQGRWPANVIFDEEAGAMLDRQSGKLTSGRLLTHHKRGGKSKLGTFNIRDRTGESCDFGGDSGGASRFFYCAKASRSERGVGNSHPTVKPIALMKYLVKLITPPNGTVLDPFAGSGSTLLACDDLKYSGIGIEKERDYCKMIGDRFEDKYE